jgi:uncharacterized protein (DUF58 family)
MTALSQSLLGKLHKKKFSVKTRRRGGHKGTRSSGMLGTSLEFSDFRPYQPGDDVRQVDWNVYGRTHKHYIKRFLDEQELNVTIFLDSTSSMRAIASKWEKAKQVAAAFSYIVLKSDDRLSFIPVSAESAGKFIRKGAVYGKNTFTEILNLTETAVTGSFIENIEKHSLRRNQLTIIISDGLEPVEKFEQLFRKLAANRQEVRFLQLLSSQELRPDFDGDMKLIDSETNANVNVSMHGYILENYQNRLREHNDQLSNHCKRYGFSYLLMADGQDIQEFLFHECTAKGWLC